VRSGHLSPGHRSGEQANGPDGSSVTANCARGVVLTKPAGARRRTEERVWRGRGTIRARWNRLLLPRNRSLRKRAGAMETRSRGFGTFHDQRDRVLIGLVTDAQAVP